MPDIVIYLLMAGGICISMAFVVWAFTAEDRAAMKAQPAELAKVHAELEALRQRKSISKGNHHAHPRHHPAPGT